MFLPSLPLWAALLVFVLCAGFIWVAGIFLSNYTDVLSGRLHLGAALGGLILLAVLIGGGPTSHIPQELLLDVAKSVPNCTLITIAAGHDIHESEPDSFAETVLDWLGDDRDPGRGQSR